MNRPVRNQKKTPKLLISFKLFFHVETTDLIQKLGDFAQEIHLNIQTLL